VARTLAHDQRAWVRAVTEERLRELGHPCPAVTAEQLVMLRTAMVFARGTDDSPTGAGTVEIKNSGHLRLRHNLEGPETVITPRLSDELCPVGAPALGQDQRGQAVLGRPCPRACLSSQFGPRPCAPNHSDPAPATVPGPDHCHSRWHPVPLARRMDSSSTVGANTQAGMSFGGGMPRAGGMMMRQDTTVASTLAAHSPLIRGRRQGRSRPVTRRLPLPCPIA
jgi:hypothetical protein